MTNRPYTQPMATSWWLLQGRYVRYMIRELTCLFITLFSVILMIGIYQISQGQAAFDSYLNILWSPSGQLVSAIILVMAVVHTLTWFNLTPKAMPLWIGDKKLPGWVIIGAHYVAWAILSLLIWLIVAGVL